MKGVASEAKFLVAQLNDSLPSSATVVCTHVLLCWRDASLNNQIFVLARCTS